MASGLSEEGAERLRQRESAKWAIGIFAFFVAVLIALGAMPLYIPQRPAP